MPHTLSQLKTLDFDLGELCFLTSQLSEAQRAELLNKGIVLARCTVPDHEGIFVPETQLLDAKHIIDHNFPRA